MSVEIDRIKILFLIHDLGQGGAEKVLVNLVNNMDRTKFDITVIALFGGGVNEQFLAKDVRFKTIFSRMIPGNSKWMKLFTPKQLHRWFIKDTYDIEVSYLEGPSARIISGCENKETRLISWIHVEQHTMEKLAGAFRSEQEARNYYNRFDQTVCVSEDVRADFCNILQFEKPCCVIHNVIDTESILALAKEAAPEILDDGMIRLVAVGTLKKSKGYRRLFQVVKQLIEEGKRLHLYVLGDGPLREELIRFVKENALENNISLLGYQVNPYKYMARCDLFVCASYAEGYSTAATEALVLGIPICSTFVSGMRELVGETTSSCGVVTENTEEAFCEGLRDFVDNKIGQEETVAAVTKRQLHLQGQKPVETVQEFFIQTLSGSVVAAQH